MKYLMLSFLCVLLLISACEIKEFSLPVWDVDFRIPLINEHYYVSDLVDSVHIVTDQNDILQIINTGELSTEEIFSVGMTPDVDISNVPILMGDNPQVMIPLQDSDNKVQLSYGELRAGQLRYRFSSVSAEVEAIVISFPDIRDATGDLLQLSYSGSEWEAADLNGYRIGTEGSGEILDSIRVTIFAAGAHPDGSQIANISLQMQNRLEFSYFEGHISHMVLEAADPAASLDVAYPYGIDNAITLSEANIVINLINELGFSCEFSGWFEARRDDQVVRVQILDESGQNYIIPAAVANGPGIKSIVIHENISDLMQIMPHHIELVQAKFLIDDSSGIGFLNVNDEITADYIIEAPFRFGVHEYPIEMQNAIKIDISEDNREYITKNLMDAGLEMQVKNTIPIGGQAFAYLGSTADIDPSNPDTYAFVKSAAIPIGSHNAPWVQLPDISLNRNQLLFFADSEVYLKWVFSFMESNGEVVITATTSDFIALKGSITAKIRVEE